MPWGKLTRPLTLPDGEEWPTGHEVFYLTSFGSHEVHIGDGHFYLVGPGYIEPAAAPRTALERLLAEDGSLGGESPQTGSTGQP